MDEVTQGLGRDNWKQVSEGKGAGSLALALATSLTLGPPVLWKHPRVLKEASFLYVC